MIENKKSKHRNKPNRMSDAEMTDRRITWKYYSNHI